MTSLRVVSGVEGYLAQYEAACADLASKHVELAGMEADLERSRALQFAQLNDGTRNITTIQREIDANTADTTADVIELRGEIAALNARLRWLDVALEHYT